MKRDVRLYLEDILDAVDKIERYVRGVSEDQFHADTLIHDGVLRRLEINGEAAKHIPAELRDAYPNVPWKRVAGTRDILAHR